MESTNKMLYPLMVLAAIGVILFSALGIATMTGYLPAALSAMTPAATQSADAAHKAKAPPAVERRGAGATRNPAVAVCANCGVVESIRIVERKGSGTGLGVVAGGLTGAVVGSQLGQGNGRSALTLLGGVGGAVAGNEIEKNLRKTSGYEVRLRMDDGSVRAVYRGSSPDVAVGDKVRLVNGTIVPQG